MAAEADRCSGLTEEVVIRESKSLFCYPPELLTVKGMA